MLREWYRWLVLVGLTALVILVTAFANSDSYDKAEVDAKVEVMQELHNKDIEHMGEQMTRVETQVDKLVDHLIEDN